MSGGRSTAGADDVDALYEHAEEVRVAMTPGGFNDPRIDRDIEPMSHVGWGEGVSTLTPRVGALRPRNGPPER